MAKNKKKMYSIVIIIVTSLLVLSAIAAIVLVVLNKQKPRAKKPAKKGFKKVSKTPEQIKTPATAPEDVAETSAIEHEEKAPKEDDPKGKQTPETEDDPKEKQTPEKEDDSKGVPVEPEKVDDPKEMPVEPETITVPTVPLIPDDNVQSLFGVDDVTLTHLVNQFENIRTATKPNWEVESVHVDVNRAFVTVPVALDEFTAARREMWAAIKDLKISEDNKNKAESQRIQQKLVGLVKESQDLKLYVLSLYKPMNVNSIRSITATPPDIAKDTEARMQKLKEFEEAIESEISGEFDPAKLAKLETDHLEMSEICSFEYIAGVHQSLVKLEKQIFSTFEKTGNIPTSKAAEFDEAFKKLSPSEIKILAMTAYYDFYFKGSKLFGDLVNIENFLQKEVQRLENNQRKETRRSLKFVVDSRKQFNAIATEINEAMGAIEGQFQKVYENQSTEESKNWMAQMRSFPLIAPNEIGKGIVNMMFIYFSVVDSGQQIAYYSAKRRYALFFIENPAL